MKTDQIDAADAPKVNPKIALTFIFVTILVDVIGIGVIIPVVPSLIRNLSPGELNDAAEIGGHLMIAFALMQFLFSPVVGELSDRFGRRPVLLISLLGLGIDYFFHAFAPSIFWLMIGRIIAGITGASFTVATAYIADISKPEDKAKNFGLIGAAFGVGFVLGPLIGGVCAKWGVQVPFIVAGVLTIINFIFGFFLVPESLPKEKRRKIDFLNMIPAVSLIKIGRYKSVLGLAFAFILINLAGQVMPAIWSFFTMQVFTWNETDVGISLAVVGLLVGVVQVVLTGKMVKKFGNKKVIGLGFIFWTLGMVGFCFASSPLILYVSLIPYVLGGIAGPTMQGVMSNSVSPKEQGNLQGALTQGMSLTAILGPLIYTSLFQTYGNVEHINYFPGAPFLAATVFVFLASAIAFVSLSKFVQSDYQYDSKNEQIIH